MKWLGCCQCEGKLTINDQCAVCGHITCPTCDKPIEQGAKSATMVMK